MDNERLREGIVQKVAEEFDLDDKFVSHILSQMEAEAGEHLYGHQTITGLIRRILDSLDQEHERFF